MSTRIFTLVLLSEILNIVISFKSNSIICSTIIRGEARSCFCSRSSSTYLSLRKNSSLRNTLHSSLYFNFLLHLRYFVTLLYFVPFLSFNFSEITECLINIYVSFLFHYFIMYLYYSYTYCPGMN